jgi:hypothetical protein
LKDDKISERRQGSTYRTGVRKLSRGHVHSPIDILIKTRATPWFLKSLVLTKVNPWFFFAMHSPEALKQGCKALIDFPIVFSLVL